MRILTVTTLYPNAESPTRHVFVENRLRQLVNQGGIEARVIAPVPWFPFRSSLFGRYGRAARVPRLETRHGVEISHPRYPVIPKVGMSLAPAFLYWALRRHLRQAGIGSASFDLIDAHYAYPDGVAAAWLGRALDKPVVVTARGSDLHLVANYRLPRRLIRNAFRDCAAVVAVSTALAECATAIAGPNLRVEVLRNGVDLVTFQPGDRDRIRRNLALDGPTLISAGLLIARKGHELVIEALAGLPDATLLICGSGPLRADLEARATRLGVAGRVRFIGEVAHEELASYYSAADVLVLASFREGWPNVLLESMACGTPVVATAVGAVPEFVDHPHAGRVVHERTPPAIASAVRALLDHPPRREDVRAYAEGFGWGETARGLKALFAEIASRHAAP